MAGSLQNKYKKRLVGRLAVVLVMLAGLVVPLFQAAPASAAPSAVLTGCNYTTTINLISSKYRGIFSGADGAGYIFGDYYGYWYDSNGAGGDATSMNAVAFYNSTGYNYPDTSPSGYVQITDHTTKVAFYADVVGLTRVDLCQTNPNATATPTNSPTATTPPPGTPTITPTSTPVVATGTGITNVELTNTAGISALGISNTNATLDHKDWSASGTIDMRYPGGSWPQTDVKLTMDLHNTNSVTLTVPEGYFDYCEVPGSYAVTIYSGSEAEQLYTTSETYLSLGVPHTISLGLPKRVYSIHVIGYRGCSTGDYVQNPINIIISGVNGVGMGDGRRSYLEDGDFELIWGQNLYWYNTQSYTYYPTWWCSFLGTVGCEDAGLDDPLPISWERYNYSACPWQAEVANGPLPPTPLECLFAPAVNAVAKIANGPAACHEGYQATDFGSPSINQDFMFDGGLVQFNGSLFWQISYRGDYKLLGGPQYGQFGTAYAYITEMTSTTPLYVLINEQAQSNEWVIKQGQIPHVPAGNYRLWVGSPDGYIVEWDAFEISNMGTLGSNYCEPDGPTPTPQMLTNTPNGYPSAQPTGTPFPWTGTPTITRTSTRTGTPGTLSPTRTPGPTRTSGPTSSPNAATATAGVQSTAYAQTATAWATHTTPATPGTTSTPWGTPQSTYTSVPGTPGVSTNTPVPLPTGGLPPIQPTVVNGGGGAIPPDDFYCVFHPEQCDMTYCMLHPTDPMCWELAYCDNHPEDPGCVLIETCKANPQDPACIYSGDTCGAPSIRPSDLNIPAWLDYEANEAKRFFCWGSAQNATAVAIPRGLYKYEPFGTVGEVVDGVIDVRTQVASYNWANNAASGVHDPISPSITSLLKAPGANVSDPWEEGAPIINLGPTSGGMPSGYVDFCGTRLTNVLSGNLAKGSCYVLSKFRDIGYLPWVQFGINIAAIGMIIRGFLTVIFNARLFGAVRQGYQAPAEGDKEKDGK